MSKQVNVRRSGSPFQNQGCVCIRTQAQCPGEGIQYPTNRPGAPINVFTRRSAARRSRGGLRLPGRVVRGCGRAGVVFELVNVLDAGGSLMPMACGGGAARPYTHVLNEGGVACAVRLTTCGGRRAVCAATLIERADVFVVGGVVAGVFLEPTFAEMIAVGYRDAIDPALQRRAANWYALDWAVWMFSLFAGAAVLAALVRPAANGARH